MEGTTCQLIICDICEKARANLKCSRCKKVEFFCDACCAEWHASKKDYMPVPINNVISKTMCNVDKEKEAEYYCPQCKIFICAECNQSKYHEGHSSLSKAQIAESIDQKRDELVKFMEKIITDAKKVKESSKLRMDEAFKQLEAMKEDFIKSTNEICAEVKQKNDFFMHMIKIQDEENIHKLYNILSQSEEKLKMLQAKKVFASSLNSKSDNILNAWALLITDKNLISEFEKELAILNNWI